MIERAIEAALAFIKVELVEHHQRIDEYGVSLASLTSHVEDCEKEKGDSERLTTIKGDIVVLRRDVDTLKSTDVTMLWGEVDVSD